MPIYSQLSLALINRPLSWRRYGRIASTGGFEPTTSRSQVRHRTTRPPRTLVYRYKITGVALLTLKGISIHMCFERLYRGLTWRRGQEEQQSPAVADKLARRESMPKLLQFDVLTTLSLTILVYLHSFSCWSVRNLRNLAKFSESSNL